MHRDDIHLCAFYQTEQQRHASLNAFLAEALKQREKLILIADPLNAKSNLICLESAGIDLHACVAEGQVRILTVHQSFLRQGVFAPVKMIAWLQNETCRARTEGYRGLRVAAEMTWVLLGAMGSERLIEYETELNDVLPGTACRVLCQYDGRRFYPAILQHVLAAHPAIMVEAAAYHNLYFRAAPSTFGEGPASATLGRWLADVSSCGQVGAG